MIKLLHKKFQNKLPVLSVFDFDGTLTYYDSFITFLRFAFSTRHFMKCMFRIVKPILLYIGNKCSHDKLKEILIKIFLTNIDKQWICYQSRVFCETYWKTLMRHTGILAVLKEVNSGAEVTLCSAAPSLILQPFANKLGVKIIATNLEVENNCLTGRISGHNCRCIQKVIRLEQVYGDLNNYYLRVWGDSRGDYELLKIAQDPYWRYFHNH